MWCNSFFWWPARVTPRAGRSLEGGQKGKTIGAHVSKTPGPTPGPGLRLPSQTLPAYSRLS